MGLGRAKDSLGDLAKWKSDRESFSELAPVGHISEVPLKGGPLPTELEYTSNESLNPISVGNNSVTSVDSIASYYSADIFGSEVFEPVSFQPHDNEKKRGNNLYCCWLLPWMDCGDDASEDNASYHSRHHTDSSTYQKRPRNSQTGALDMPIQRQYSGIMRRGSAKRSMVAEGIVNNPRRSILPTVYRDSTPQKLFILREVRFVSIARRTTIKSHYSMTEEEKSSIWWQNKDYEVFRRHNFLITKTILEGGVDIWLSGSKNPQCSNEDLKWWHEFGHSRRGLEQVVSTAEANQRQENMKLAIRTVLDEQKRLKILTRYSPEKLAMMAREYTAWAKDLALAAAASDADAVQSNFVETRKSREYFLLKHTLASECTVPSHTPDFMVPDGVPTKILDDNTSSNIFYRKRMQKQIEAKREQRE